MLPAVIAYPQIDPVAISLGPLPIRWYALAYIAGLLLGFEQKDADLFAIAGFVEQILG